MKLKRHEPTQPYADLQTIISISRVLATDPANTRAREFIQWVDSFGRKVTDDDFEKWCKGKGIRMVGKGKN